MDQATSGDDERRCDLETSLGTALIRAGDPAHRSVLSRAARRAQQIGDDHRLALAVLVGTRGGTSAAGALDPERIEVFEVALAVVGPDQPALRARLLAGLAAEIMFEGQTQRREQLSMRHSAWRATTLTLTFWPKCSLWRSRRWAASAVTVHWPSRHRAH